MSWSRTEELAIYSVVAMTAAAAYLASRWLLAMGHIELWTHLNVFAGSAVTISMMWPLIARRVYLLRGGTDV